jgi:predicted ATP-grasp superfamily ATP-dependent carboligase
MNTRVPVLVIFRGGYGAVAVARTLGRLGVPAYLLAQEGATTPVWSSRYWRKKIRWDFSKPESDSLAFLIEVGRRLQAEHGARPILLTLADWVAIFIERNGDVLQEQFVFPRAATPVIRGLANKWEMHLLANEHAIPTPATICPRSRADVEEFLQNQPFPIVLKPADPYLPHAPDKRIFASSRELMVEVDRETAYGPLNFVLQEYIPGDAQAVWMCNGYFSPEPERDVVFTGKKLRQVSSTGIASLAICLRNETVEAQTRSFMQGIGYRGCVGIGYRFDSRDGLYKLLDVNARVSGVFRLFSGTNDMDVVRICYLDLTDQHPPATALRPGRKWMLEDDIPTALGAIRDGSLTLSQWIDSIRGVREAHWFAPDDPMPVLTWLRNGIQRRAQARFPRPSRGKTTHESSADQIPQDRSAQQ